jgi:hypothetical protein
MLAMQPDKVPRKSWQFKFNAGARVSPTKGELAHVECVFVIGNIAHVNVSGVSNVLGKIAKVEPPSRLQISRLQLR